MEARLLTEPCLSWTGLLRQTYCCCSCCVGSGSDLLRYTEWNGDDGRLTGICLALVSQRIFIFSCQRSGLTVVTIVETLVVGTVVGTGEVGLKVSAVEQDSQTVLKTEV